MRKKGKKLLFISRIDAQGVSFHFPDSEYIKQVKNEVFRLRTLSLTYETFIASGFHTFVVRLKSKKHAKKTKSS